MLAHFWGPRKKHPTKQHKNTARDFSLAVFVVGVPKKPQGFLG